VIEGGNERRRADTQTRMQAKIYFWLGMALCIGGIWMAVDAGNQWSGHLFGGALILAGVVIAARNARR